MRLVAPKKTRWLTAREQKAWRGYIRMNAVLNAHLERDLRRETDLSMADFGVLVELSEHPSDRMRVLELAKALQWEKSRLSHQLTRMQTRGLVTRIECEDDRRGAWMQLTKKGRATVEAAAPLHVSAVRRAVFDVLSRDEVDSLAALSGRVVGALEADAADD
jgi:DNA-binding MarR family transcriptional regulator